MTERKPMIAVLTGAGISTDSGNCGEPEKEALGE